jgi:hypothetical protein
MEVEFNIIYNPPRPRPPSPNLALRRHMYEHDPRTSQLRLMAAMIGKRLVNCDHEAADMRTIDFSSSHSITENDIDLGKIITEKVINDR